MQDSQRNVSIRLICLTSGGFIHPEKEIETKLPSRCSDVLETGYLQGRDILVTYRAHLALNYIIVCEGHT